MPRTKGSKNTKTRKTVTRVGSYNSMDDIASDVNVVLRSLINQDGKFTTQEASAISKIYGNQLSLAKIKLDAAKMAHSTSDATDKVLSLK